MEKTLNLILKKLDSIDSEIKTINNRLNNLEEGQRKLGSDIKELKQGQ
ncbi:MAG: hypothetical protein H0Z24_10485, partial [Thermosipho sp. (in: Bacteria)]|nr:hypothetical protein [Thermosipho sp. (in: thermotogales)]